MTSPELQRAFAEDVVFLRYAGLRPVVVHGGGPQITEHLDRLGIAERVPRRPAGHHPGGDGGRPDGARRPGQRRHRQPDQRPRPVRGRPVRRGRRAAHAPSAAPAIVDGARGRHRPGRRRGRPSTRRRDRRCSTPAGSRSSPRWRRGADGLSYNVNADTAAAAHRGRPAAREKLIVLTDVEGLYADWPAQRRGRQRDRRRTSWRRCCRRWTAAWCPKMEACLRAVEGGVPRGARARRPGAARAAAGDLHHRRDRHDGAADRGRSSDAAGQRDSAGTRS